MHFGKIEHASTATVIVSLRLWATAHLEEVSMIIFGRTSKYNGVYLGVIYFPRYPQMFSQSPFPGPREGEMGWIELRRALPRVRAIHSQERTAAVAARLARRARGWLCLTKTASLAQHHRADVDDFQNALRFSMIQRMIAWLARALQTPWYCNNNDRSCTYRQRCHTCLENPGGL